jgi:hypothetical protein
MKEETMASAISITPNDVQAALTGEPPPQALSEAKAIPLWGWPWRLLGGLVFFLVVEGEKLLIRLVRPSRGSSATVARVPA